MNDAQLLQNFAEQNSEAAFRSLVERHLPLVFGTARRMTGDNALAEDIAQTVFILLAAKAKRLGRDTILSGWLYRTARFVASRALIAEQRRRRREQEAVTMQSSTPSDPSWLRWKSSRPLPVRSAPMAWRFSSKCLRAITFSKSNCSIQPTGRRRPVSTTNLRSSSPACAPRSPCRKRPASPAMPRRPAGGLFTRPALTPRPLWRAECLLIRSVRSGLISHAGRPPGAP